MNPILRFYQNSKMCFEDLKISILGLKSIIDSCGFGLADFDFLLVIGT